TLISMPAKGFAASMNHCISFSWPARSRLDTSPISESRNFCASSIPAKAVPVIASSTAAVVVIRCRRISSSQGCDCTHSRGGGAFRFRIYLPSDSPEHDERIEDAERKSPPQAGADKPKPCEIDKGCTEQRDEKPGSPGCREAQDADTRMAARPRRFPRRHQSQEREDGQEENCRRKGPGHPSARHEGCEPVAF